jgi:2-phosphoglycerate kinase
MRQLYLIGGAAGAGKTTTGRALSRRLDADWLQVDSIWVAVAEALPPGHPAREALELDKAIRSTEYSAADLMAVQTAAAESICAILPRVLDFEIRAYDRVIADGAWLLPEFMAGLQLPETTIRAAIIYEPEAAEVKRAMRSRSSTAATSPWQAALAEMSWLYGNWLEAKSARFGIPVVAARPRGSLVHRVATSLGLDGSR